MRTLLHVLLLFLPQKCSARHSHGGIGSVIAARAAPRLEGTGLTAIDVITLPHWLAFYLFTTMMHFKPTINPPVVVIQAANTEGMDVL